MKTNSLIARTAPALAAAALLAASAPVHAQTAPPSAAPPASAPPPSPAQPPQSTYPPPGGYPPYGYPPPGYAPLFYPYMYAPRQIEWEPGQPIPPGYRPSTKIRTGLVIGGAVTLGSAWLTSAIFASFFVGGDGGGAVAPLFAPVVGPFITIGTIGTHDLEALGTFLLVFDGVVQAAGLGMLLGGLIATQPILVRTGSVTLTPTPISFGKAGSGFGVTGTF